MSSAVLATGGPPRFLTDANFTLHILAGLRRRQPNIEVLTAQQLQLLEVPDPEVLLVAKKHDRILLTHDRKTMPDHLEALLRILPSGEHSPGVMSVAQLLPVGSSIEAMLLVWECSVHEEWPDQFIYLPL